jgi:hypothetical protein
VPRQKSRSSEYCVAAPANPRFGPKLPRDPQYFGPIPVVPRLVALYSPGQSSTSASSPRHLVPSLVPEAKNSVKPTAAELDEILALQLTVAWAGESAGDPKRLGWWKSDLVDREGGGDLFARLVPKTAQWASLGLVRKAAMRVDEAARDKLAQGDRVWTLFHFGFALDELLQDRLVWHRNHQDVPAETLGPSFLVDSKWSKASFEAMLAELGKPKVQVTPSGRQLTTKAKSPVETARLLAAALVPLSAEYPLPYAEISP